MRTHRLSRLWAIIALPALFATLVFAQGGLGTVSGLITDASGAPVAGTAVTLTNPATGARLQSRTSSAGLYSFPALNPGTYELQASHAGFASIQQRNITVAVDHATAVNLTLHPGTVHQVVEVTAAPGLAATTNTTVGQLISAEMINRVPLVTRDVYQLVQLTPGITPVNGVVNNVDFNARPGAEVSGYTINGAQQGSLYYTLDGSPISIGENNLGSLIPAFQPPLDSIQEYRVETNNVTATQQSGGAGVISLVSKSGTNKFHGDLFAYARPNALDANDSFAKAAELEAGQPNKPLNFHRYQEGGSIGGPILHNKLFFFADYEATQQESLQTGSYTVPTAAERQGNFSADPFTVYNPLV
ncbi:MAG: carboxypeptidase regulatory-like domain-containing protein, partial [Terriglobales bacterium]